MPFDLNWEPEGIYKHFYGFVTNEEFFSSVLMLQGDERFDRIQYSLNDFSAITGHNLSLADVKKAAGFASGAACSNPNIRIVVISEDPEIVKLVTFYASLPFQKYEVKIFNRQDAARAWLLAQPPLTRFERYALPQNWAATT
jgi:hypothetical protein